MLRKICLCLWFGALLTRLVAAEAVERDSREYAFVRANFERVNGGDKQEELNEAFDAISEAVKGIQRFAPQVSLGGMLALVMYESEMRLGFFNTRDKENAFNPSKRIPYVPKLDPHVPFWQQPLGRYSYQLGMVPIHTSNFRPCVAGTQDARRRFDRMASGVLLMRSKCERSIAGFTAAAPQLKWP